MLTLVCFVLFLLSTNAALDFEATTYLKAFNIPNYDDNFFGQCVALSGDGKTLAVAAPGDSNRNGGVNSQYYHSDNFSKSGAVWVYVQTANLSWALQAYIKASNPDMGDNFGAPSLPFKYLSSFGPRCSLSLSYDGSVLAAGAAGEDSAATGIGGNQSWNNATSAGAVYVYQRSSVDVWTQEAYIKASNAGAGDFFGASLSLSSDGRSLAVGAPGEASSAVGLNGNQSDNSQPISGAVYLYVKSGEWIQKQYIKPPAATFSQFSKLMNFSAFGCSVSISGDGKRLAIGSDGAVTVMNLNLDGYWDTEPPLSVSSGFCEDVNVGGLEMVLGLPLLYREMLLRLQWVLQHTGILHRTMVM